MSATPTVECCLRNVDAAGYRRVRAADAAVGTQHCLGRCGVCRSGPFLVIDGAVAKGPHGRLLEGLSGEDA